MKAEQVDARSNAMNQRKRICEMISGLEAEYIEAARAVAGSAPNDAALSGFRAGAWNAAARAVNAHDELLAAIEAIELFCQRMIDGDVTKVEYMGEQYSPMNDALDAAQLRKLARAALSAGRDGG